MSNAQAHTTSMAPRRPHRTALQLAAIGVLFVLIGLWYAGSTYAKNINWAIPHLSIGGAVVEMAPGDQYDGYYRHLLPYFNAKRGNPPFYTGYQYNLGQAEPFREGMIYLPFSLLASLLAFVLGPITAYNMLVLLSFPLCAIFSYLLGREVSGGSRAAGLVCAAVITLVPFRVGFLFEQTFYGTDIALLPLALYTFIRFLKLQRWEPALAFGAAILALATANIALFYWFCLLFTPYFLWGAATSAKRMWGDWGRISKIALALAVPFALTLLFLLNVREIMGASGLGPGQGLDEVRFFSPKFADMFRRWSGIETSIYLGVAGLLATVGMLSLFFARPADRVARSIGVYAAVSFVVAHALALGTTFDDATGIALYEFVFNHIPLANGSRTPGRIIPVAVLSAGVLVALAYRWMAGQRNQNVRAGIAILLTGLIALDFKYTNVSMTKVAGANKAYAAIDGRAGTTLGIPIRPEAEHYLHATYQYYAVTNDVRMVNGHSSMFPPGWAEFHAQVEPINQGMATQAVLDALWSRGVRYITAHATIAEPQVSQVAVRMLEANPALRRIDSDGGITAFEIVDPARAPRSITREAFLDALLPAGSSAAATGPVQAVAGWHPLESYAGQAPFRWMSGKESLVLVQAPGDAGRRLEFDFRCPMSDLVIDAGPHATSAVSPSSTPGWTHASVDLPSEARIVVALSTASIYNAAGDPRDFGCMVGDFTLQPARD